MLRRDNPAHKALLDAEAAARGIPVQQEEGSEQQNGGSSSGQRVKRERGSRAAGRSAAQRTKRERSALGAPIDLTGGMRSRRDPTLLETCDLTAAEDAPTWTAKKRAAAAAHTLL